MLLPTPPVEGAAASEEPEPDDPPPHPSHHCGPLCHPGHQDQLWSPYFIKQKQDSIYYFWHSSSLAPPPTIVAVEANSKDLSL